MTRSLTFNPDARPHAELLSGSCIWDDVIRRGWCFRCIGGARILSRARYSMTVGEPVPPEFQALWDQTEEKFPNWPIFLRERRSPGNAVEVRRVVDEMNERELGPIEAETPAEEDEPPNPAIQRTPATATGFRRFLRSFGGRVR